MYGDPPSKGEPLGAKVTERGTALASRLLAEEEIHAAFSAKNWERFDALVAQKCDLAPISARLLVLMEVLRRAGAN